MLTIEGQVLFDAIFVSRMDRGRAAEGTPTSWPFGLQQMALAGVCAQNLAAGSDFETFRYGLFCFDSLWTPHNKVNSVKRARNIRGAL